MAKVKTKMPVEKLKGIVSNPQPAEVMVKKDPGYDERERKYRAKSALEDIERAEVHRKDKDLMRDVKACAKEKMQAYKKL